MSKEEVEAYVQDTHSVHVQQHSLPLLWCSLFSTMIASQTAIASSLCPATLSAWQITQAQHLSLFPRQQHEYGQTHPRQPKGVHIDMDTSGKALQVGSAFAFADERYHLGKYNTKGTTHRYNQSTGLLIPHPTVLSWTTTTTGQLYYYTSHLYMS